MDAMEPIINALPTFLAGVLVGIVGMAIFNKLRGGSANPATTKDAFDQYKADVAEHFTETGRKFQSMATQYQELYEHLAVGAHTLLDNETADRMLAPPKKPDVSDAERASGKTAPSSKLTGNAKTGDQSGSSKSKKPEPAADASTRKSPTSKTA